MLSIVLPCYNEAQNIPLIWNSFNKYLQGRNDIEVILVNNGSTDLSESVLDNLLKKNYNSIFKVINVPVNRGYGFGILAGLDAANGDVLAWTHADLQTDLADVLYGYELYLQHKSKITFIKGSRINRKFHAWIFSFGMEVISSIALQLKMEEINAQPKIFSKEFYLTHMKNKAPYDFSLDLFTCYQAYKYANVQTIPVKVNKRMFGDAKGGGSIKTKIKLIYRTFDYIFTLRKRLNSHTFIK